MELFVAFPGRIPTHVFACEWGTRVSFGLSSGEQASSRNASPSLDRPKIARKAQSLDLTSLTLATPNVVDLYIRDNLVCPTSPLLDYTVESHERPDPVVPVRERTLDWKQRLT
ncbi:hypothetical protein FRC12_021721 [Ceratobasidium sp. 428]|nr:hypothetical protein FRC12_021721 [Ceratobasidium sp. 428]